jgi:hypothetical protein
MSEKIEKLKDYYQCGVCKVYFKPENVVKLHSAEETKITHVCNECFNLNYKHK